MTGNNALLIAFVKKLGSNNRGITYPSIIPYSFVIPSIEILLNVAAAVNIIGSKKYPIDPINLPPVVGIAILSISLILKTFGFISFLVILNDFGINKNKTKIEVNSLIALIATKQLTAYIKFLLNIISLLNFF